MACLLLNNLRLDIRIRLIVKRLDFALDLVRIKPQLLCLFLGLIVLDMIVELLHSLQIDLLLGDVPGLEEWVAKILIVTHAVHALRIHLLLVCHQCIQDLLPTSFQFVFFVDSMDHEEAFEFIQLQIER